MFFCKKTNIYYVYYTVLFKRSTRHKRKYQPAHNGIRIQAFREKRTRPSYHNHRSSPTPEWQPGVPPIAPKFHSPSAGASGSRSWQAAPNSAESRHRGKQVRQLKLPPFVPATWTHSHPSVRGKSSHPPLVSILRP